MQLKTRIIVDSAADLVPEIKERVYTVPLTVHFGQEEYIDGVTIDHKTFYEKLVGSDVLPTTSQATPNDFIGAFETARQAGEGRRCHHPCVQVLRHVSRRRNCGGGI